MTNPISADISIIKLWFERAVPNPTDKNRAVQIGVHFEEVAEMAEAIREDKVHEKLAYIADFHKRLNQGFATDDPLVNRKELLDSLCDQIVTAVGVAHMFGMDIAGALSEVNRSNWSKFIDGQPVFNEHGKIAKGPEYTPPNLDSFL
jgi:NTP pyrophosphatase (non-canonical NTP hydrolase)